MLLSPALCEWGRVEVLQPCVALVLSLRWAVPVWSLPALQLDSAFPSATLSTFCRRAEGHFFFFFFEKAERTYLCATCLGVVQHRNGQELELWGRFQSGGPQRVLMGLCGKSLS